MTETERHKQVKLNGDIKIDEPMVCVVCGLEFVPKSENQLYCSITCRKLSQLERNKDRNLGFKHRVFELYGNRCNHCGETDQIVLSLDHIKPVGKNRRSTYVLFPIILKNPDLHKNKYQLLCRNCNWRKMILNNERESSPPFAYRHELNRLESKINELTSKFETETNKHNNIFNDTNGGKPYDDFEDVLVYISKTKNQIPLKPNGAIHSGKCVKWIRELGFKIKSREEPSLIAEIKKLGNAKRRNERYDKEVG